MKVKDLLKSLGVATLIITGLLYLISLIGYAINISDKQDIILIHELRIEEKLDSLNEVEKENNSFVKEIVRDSNDNGGKQ